MQEKMVFQRYEFKYLMTRRQRDRILAVMDPYMVADEYGHSSIRNLYLDTPDFRLIRQSLDKPVYKEKLRVRSYSRAGAGDTVFVELKKKYRSVVYKRRLSLPQDRAMACLAGDCPWPDTQIAGELAYAVDFYRALSPAVFLSYERDAFHSNGEDGFRVTFDEDILFRREELTLDSQPWGTPLLKPDQVLMELKAAGSIPLWMVQALSEAGLFKTSFSKYGAAYRLMAARGLERGRKYA